MKKIISFLKSLFPEWGMDKWAHLGIGGLASALIAIPFIIQEFEPSWGLALYPIAGLIPLLIFSVFKELIDSTGFDWRDILAAVIGWFLIELATVFGGIAGVKFWDMFNHLTKRFTFRELCESEIKEGL